MINFSSIDILEEGEILVGVDEQKYLQYFYDDVRVSLDYGMTWEIMNIGSGDHNIVKLITDLEHGYTIGAISENGPTGFFMSIIHLSDIMGIYYFLRFLERGCELSDYIFYTPGSQIRGQCFMGRRGYSYYKKPSSVCVSSKGYLPNINSQACACEQEDYQWYFIHFIN
ncbi:hypothetical protein RF11_05981 [Thelohanellus kitauei]|uniref:Sortilin C-terminal domain-containing protein n=1 Tax=Thelohanellus kitauei TaxID=669202 RepID=A0A0C2II32_THEKT|nr:hypothetical protein RF11_05981 [Thelohanellus kitauei]